MEIKHTTVLKEEAVDGLKVRDDGIYIDATFGLGGHSTEILSRAKNVKVIGIEVDKEIYKYAKNNFSHNKNISLYNSNFIDVGDVVVSHRLAKVDGVIFDCGTNVYQIKDSGRGFSFLKNERLDMRLDQDGDLTAEMIVNSYPKEELERIFKNVDERFSRPIAKRITEERKKQRIETTEQLVNIVRSVKRQTGKTNPATLVFMALRIEVNNELENLEKGIEECLKVVKSGGRVVVISFHSGEDRIVKRLFKEKEKAGAIKIINKKVIIPERDELLKNPLSRSAKMRIVEVV